MSVLLLFGAGASYGAGGIRKAPPLSNVLLLELQKAFPATWGQINALLSKKLASDFEKGMDELSQDLKNNLARLLWDMAIYFSRFKIDYPSNNLYWQIVDKYKGPLIRNDIVLSTLNYDCLIESALHHAGFLPEYHGNAPGPRLLKPHGSCNFMPRGVKGSVLEMNLEIEAGAIINCPLEAVNPECVESEIHTTLYPPAMSLFVSKKTDIVTPKIISNIRDEFKERALKARKIISIGVKPNPDDTHIWKPIAESSGEVLLVGGEGECRNWIKEHRTDAVYIGGKFTDSFSKICQSISSVLNA